MNPEPSRFELFQSEAKADIGAYRERLKGDGTFNYVSQVLDLQKLSTNLSVRMFVYLFGEQLGGHLAEKFIGQCSRNLLYFLTQLTSEYRFYILHELKNNPHLFAYS